MRSTVSPRPAFISSLTFRRRRISSQRLQHPLFLDALQAPLQKIDLQCLLTDLSFQLGHPPFRPALLAIARKHVAWGLSEFAPPAVQHVRVDFHPSRHLRDRYTLLQPPYGG